MSKDDIQEQLVERLTEEKRQEALRRKERNEAHLFISISAYTEDNIMVHKGIDLINQERTPCFTFKVNKNGTYKDAIETIAEHMKYPVSGIRLWPFITRNNHSFRPTRVVNETDFCTGIMDSMNNSCVFVETIPPQYPHKELPVSEKDGKTADRFNFRLVLIFNYFLFVCLLVHVLVFLKYYDPKNNFLTYCGYCHFPRDIVFADILPILCEKAGLPRATPLVIYEEEYLNCINPIRNYNQPLHSAVNELMDGDILVFERQQSEDEHYPNLKDYFADLLHRVEVQFCDKNNPNDPGFLLELSFKMNYNQIANAVAMRLGTDPTMLQFFKNQSSYREGPGCALRCTYDGTLKDILMYFKPRQPKKIYYQHVSSLDGLICNVTHLFILLPICS